MPHLWPRVGAPVGHRRTRHALVPGLPTVTRTVRAANMVGCGSHLATDRLRSSSSTAIRRRSPNRRSGSGDGSSAMIEHLNDDEWSHPSRCDGWSARDVAVHLASTNAFWEVSIRSGIDGCADGDAGEVRSGRHPCRDGRGFDADTPTRSSRRSRRRRSHLPISSSDCGRPTGRRRPRRRPGTWASSAVVHHALWDSWIHERDIALPLGRTPDVEPDEVIASLRYVAALSRRRLPRGGRLGNGRVRRRRRPTRTPSFHVAIADDVVVTTGTSGSGFELAGHAARTARSVELPPPARTDDSARSSTGPSGVWAQPSTAELRVVRVLRALRGVTSLLLCS